MRAATEPTMSTLDNFIGGRWVPAASSERITVRNPAAPQHVVAEVAASDARDVAAAIAAASEAQPAWASTTASVRSAYLLRLAQALEDDADALGRIITLEQGKALGEAKGEALRAAAELRFMAGECLRPYGEVFPSEKNDVSVETRLEPIGVVAAIAPWNFPVVTPVRKIGPALAWGNTVVLKPSSLTPWAAVRLAQLCERVGLPDGVVNVVTGAGKVGEALAEHPQVAGVSFTGSTATGRRIYERVAARLGRVQLELGGKNPAIVHACDDLATAAREIVLAAFLCSGQRCTALSRVIVTEPQADSLVERLEHEVDRIVVGDGLAEGTTMGPLVSQSQLETVRRYVETGRRDGAQLRRGGDVPPHLADAGGYFFAPTLFDRVSPRASIAREEIFGPVLPVIRVADIEQAIAVANDTDYGLAASVFTSDATAARRCVHGLQTGMVHVNHGTASQAHVPFGGVKESGQGAYSIGATAREFFTSLKAVYVRW